MDGPTARRKRRPHVLLSPRLIAAARATMAAPATMQREPVGLPIEAVGLLAVPLVGLCLRAAPRR